MWRATLTGRFTGNEGYFGLGRTLALLSPAEAEELGERIDALTHEFMAGKQDSEAPDARAYAFTFTLLPSELG